MAEPIRIFVSHGHQDNDWCRAFVAGLRARGADVWYDEHNLGYGVLQEEIERELRARSVFIVILSPRAVNSPWVQRELAAATHLRDLHPDRVILPVIAEKCDIPLLWISYKRISGPDDTGVMPEDAAGRIAHMLGFTAAQPATVAQAAPATTPHMVTSAAISVAAAAPSIPLPQSATKRRPAHQRAITDLYDEERRTTLVRFPVPLVISLVLSGIVALSLTGFFGFRVPPADSGQSFQPIGLDTLFKVPWPLFLWFCSIAIVLEAAILRSKTLRSARTSAIVVTFIFMVLVGTSFFDGLIQQALDLSRGTPEIGRSPYLYTLINFGVLAIFWISAIRRINSSGHLTGHAPQLRLRLTAMYVLGGASLAFVLALIFRTGLMNVISSALGSSFTVNTCMVSWPFGACGAGATPADPPTLFFMDLVATVLQIIVGLMLLFISLVSAGSSGQSSTEVREDMVLADSPGVLGNLVLSIKPLVWPLLLLVAVLAIAAGTREMQSYLHLLSDKKTCVLPGYPSCGYVSNTLLTGGQPYISLLFALLDWAGGLLALILAVALNVFSRRVVSNTLRFVWRLGGMVLISYWIVALLLSAFNGLLWLFDHNVRMPFSQPDLLTIISAAAFILTGIVRVFRRPSPQAA